MCRRGALTFALFLFVVAIFLLVPQRLLADGGHGTGITFPAATPSSETIDTTINFSAYHHWTDPRIKKDFNLLLSPEVLSRIGTVVRDTQQAVDDLLSELDDVENNEFGLPYHDFALVYNYFARPEHPYGEWGGQQNVFFNLGYPGSEQNHVDFYLAAYGYEPEKSEYGFAGVWPSTFWDFEEDSLELKDSYRANSLQGYDGPNGLDKGNPNWYKSGGGCNVRFDHEFQHVCYWSNINRGFYIGGWPNEMFSTAAEYLCGVSAGSEFWEPINDVACDAGLIGFREPPRTKQYGMWRLFAAYLFHQFNPNELEYTDDLIYKWNSTWQEYAADGLTAPKLYALGKELEKSPWSTMLVGTNGLAKLQNLFRDWSVALCVNDSTLYPPWGDGITLGFKRGLSPYYDIGLFRDVDTSCCAYNSPVLPHEHTVGQSRIDNFTWVTSYTSHEDSTWGTCPSCKGSQLTVAQKADAIDVPLWGADYILFESNDSLGSGGPYDLKIKIRGERNSPSFNRPHDNTKIQVSVLTYSSPDSVFRTSDNLIEVRELYIDPDSAKANVTVCDFGGSVKAAVVMVGLVWNYWGPWDRDTLPADYVDGNTQTLWDYKYGYTVEKHWKSGSVVSSVVWFDSIHVSGDVMVPLNRTLTIEPGTRMEFYPGDTQHGGQDSNRSELILGSGSFMGPGGKLVAKGAPNDTILFTSGASSPGPYDWYGVRMLEDGSPLEAKYCRFENAACPIVCIGDTLVVDSCLIRSFGDVGIYAGDTSRVTVEGSTIDVSSGSKGIQLVGNSSGVITRNRIVGSGGGGAGVLTHSGSSATVSHNTIASVYTGIDAYGDSLSSSHNHISGFQNAGIKVSGGAAGISYDTLDVGSTGVSGIELVGSSPADVSHNLLTGSSSGLRYGIKSSGVTSGSVSYNRIENVLAGMKVYGSSDLQVERNVFEDNGSVGISVEGSAEVGIRRNSITDYTYYGVVVKNSAHADMGAQPDSGVNRVFTDSYLVGRYWVMNKTADTVMAEYNWWGTDDPYFLMLFYGNVDWVPFLTEDPGMPFALRMPGTVLGKSAVGYAVQNYPNPMNPVTTIEYGVPEDGTHVLVRVFDVSGRLVKTLVEGRELAGMHTVIWDGRGEDNRGVASGVYVYEAVIGEQRVTKKLVVLK